MKKIFSLIIVFIVVLCFFMPVHAEEVPNLLDSINSGFEGVTDLKDTKWYKLFNAYGNSKASDELYKGIEIKNNGGHTGDNYISMTAEMSWYSPSLNVYPFIAEAGEDSYVISFWYKSSSSLKVSRILLRGLATDAYEEKGVYMPDIAAVGNGNHYGVITGTSTDPDENGWRCFVSQTFDVVSEQLKGEHNWWFCLDQLPAKSGSPFTLDIDDFVICSEAEFEIPEGAEKKVYSAELSYISDDLKNNAFPVAKTEATPIPSAPTEITPVPDITPAPIEGVNISSVIVYSSGALLVCAVLAFIVMFIIKSKKK